MTGLIALAACTTPASSNDHAAVLRLDEFVRLGSMDDAGSALSSVAAVARADSTVFVLERDPPRLAVFGLDGTWHHSLGRAGDGPGELRNPSLIGLVGEDVWIGAPFGGRLEVLTRDGAPVHSYRWDIDPDSGGVRAFPTALLSDGAVLAGPGSLSIGGAVSGRIRHQTYYRTSADGAVTKVLYRRTLAPTDFGSASLSTGGSIVGMHPIQESPLVEAYPDGSGLVVVERAEATQPVGATWRLEVISTNGTVETDRHVLYQPVLATGWLKRRLAKVEKDMVRRSGSVNRGLLDALQKAWPDRRYYPPVTAVVAGGDGSIWIRREEAGADSVAWQVFARDGVELGELSTRTSLRILSATRSEVWAVETNEWDVPFVVGMRVVVSDGARTN